MLTPPKKAPKVSKNGHGAGLADLQKQYRKAKTPEEKKKIQSEIKALKAKTQGAAKAARSTRKRAVSSGWSTPCDQYNQAHADGNGNCDECTSILFNPAVAKTEPYILVMSRSGEAYPLRRFKKPMVKAKDYTQRCQWCPETQTCGHPMDSSTTCTRPGSTNPFAGFVKRGHCKGSTCSFYHPVVSALPVVVVGGGGLA